MIFMNVRLSEAVEAGVLKKEEADWVDTLRIPYSGGGDLWREKYRLESLIKKALQDGVLSEVSQEPPIKRYSYNVISDSLGEGVQGLLNHADGKKYDSKSAYYKAVKAAGCVVLGNDAPTEAKKVEYKLDSREIKQDIKQAIEQLGG